MKLTKITQQQFFKTFCPTCQQEYDTTVFYRGFHNCPKCMRMKINQQNRRDYIRSNVHDKTQT